MIFLNFNVVIQKWRIPTLLIVISMKFDANLLDKIHFEANSILTLTSIFNTKLTLKKYDVIGRTNH